MDETTPPAVTAAAKTFRPLKWNELVKRGDYVEDGNHGFEPWVGPAGFRADAFIKQIYCKQSRAPVVAEKPPE